ncbi:MAG: DNA/RNA non-specific endonuclease [Alloprevotella sp.]|nr:DNA/RNA non-specific endonuclease [Alloprevotella sp.]
MSFINKLYPLIAAAAVLLTAAACGDDDDGIRYGGSSGDTPSGTGQSDARPAVLSRMEVPELKSGNVFVSHWTLQGRDSVMTYCLEFDPQKYHSRWVAFRFDNKTRAKGIGRTEAWADDPELPQGLRIGTAYFGSGYSRGHLCASADRLYSAEANAQTFYMSNMSPQLSDFNAGLWQKLEAYVQGIGRDAAFADTLYVVKGGTIADGQLKGAPLVRNGGLQSIAVPQHYFMALLKVKNNTYSGVAFLMEHRNYGSVTERAYIPYALTIDELENFTGINFFPNLPDQVEEVVEATFTPSAWQLN